MTSRVRQQGPNDLPVPSRSKTAGVWTAHGSAAAFRFAGGRPPLVPSLPAALQHFVGASEKFARLPQQDCARPREADGVSRALEQTLAKFVFKRLDLAAHRRRGNEHFLRRAADPARPGHSHEVTPWSEGHARMHDREPGSGQEPGIGRMSDPRTSYWDDYS